MPLEKELELFEKNLPLLLKEHRGKFALILGDSFVGAYLSADEALAEGARLFGAQSFLVRQIVEVQPEASIPALTMGLLHADLSHTV
jgi:hypothetical protein